MEKINISTKVNAPIDQVWDAYNSPEHITKWNFADQSWHCPKAESDLRIGGNFKSRMEAKDGSFGFDFQGFYDDVIPNERIKYHMEDGRNVEINFSANENATTQIDISFDPETINPLEMQKGGWQAILNNFKKYTEEKYLNK